MKKAVSLLLMLTFLITAMFADTIIVPTIGFSHIAGKNLKNRTLRGSYDVFDNVDISWGPMTIGLGIGTINKNGFLFMWDNFASFIGKFNSKTSINTNDIESLLGATAGSVTVNDITSSNRMTGGVFYETNLMFGYSFHPVEKTHINLALGLAMGIGKFHLTIKDIKEWIGVSNLDDRFKKSKYIVLAGIPLQFEFQYYFTKQIGLNIGIFDTIGYGAVLLFPEVNATYTDAGGTKTKKQVTVLFGKGFMNNFTFKVGPVFRLSR
ncbi:MAG: hypothetical protein CR988_06950 [Treponema sp.]|nr:MAG: hypothetical protein CR988_06950 [Treponema sp.]